MEVVTAVQVDNDCLSDGESLYQFIVELVEIEKLMIFLYR